MNKEVLTPYQAQQKRACFAREVVARGILERFVRSERNQNVFLMSNLTHLTHGQLGELYPKPSGEPLTRGRIQQIADRVLRTVWRQSPEDLQDLYPREDLLIQRPKLRSKGLTAQVRELVEKGITDPKQIEEEAGLPHSRLGAIRAYLQKEGLEIPLIKSASSDFLIEAKQETNLKKLQTLLDSCPPNVLFLIYKTRKGEDKVLTTLLPVLTKAGFHLKTQYLHLFAEIVKGNGIPLRKILRREKQIYYIVFAKHQQQITKAVQNDPNLQRFRKNPVRLVCGTLDKIPTTTKLKKLKRENSEYAALFPLMKEVADHELNPKAVEILLRGCPVPVVNFSEKQRNRYLYPKSQRGKLKIFLLSKLASQASQGDALRG